MSLISHIIKTFEKKNKFSWKTMYISVDIHGTILYPTHNKDILSTKFYPFAKETLQILSKRNDITLIMHTSSYANKQLDYLRFFHNNRIDFKYSNINPRVKNDNIGCYDEKFYIDIGIDDKYGFDAENDWEEIYNLLINNII